MRSTAFAHRDGERPDDVAMIFYALDMVRDRINAEMTADRRRATSNVGPGAG